MKITHLSNETVKEVRLEIEKALREIGERRGLKISTLGNLSYNATTIFTQKLTIALEESQKIEASSLIDYVGKRFKMGARTFTIEGVEKGKLVGRTNRGKGYLLTVEQVQNMIKL